MTDTSDALVLLASKTPERHILSLHRIIPADAAAPARQRSGWLLVIADALKWTETVREWWGDTPEAAVNAALDGLG